MTRALIYALATILIATTAFAAPRFRLIVPVELENLPAAIKRGQITCQVSTAAHFDPTSSIGGGTVDFAIEGGRFSGRVGMDVIVTGAPVGTDGTLDGHSYSCALFLMYQCTRADSSEPGWCVSNAGGLAGPSATASVRALFATDPARPPAGRIEGTIDRGSATTLPVRTM